MSSSFLQIHRTGPVLTLELARPAQRNALNTALCEQLIDALDAAETEDDLHLLVLRAQGPLFCAGADLKEFSAEEASQALKARRHRLTLLQRLSCTLRHHRLPVLAVLQGAAIGAGANLALSCDQILAARNACLHYPELAHGIDPSSMVPMLARHLPAKRLTETLWMGERLGAEEALHWGLFNALAEPDGLEALLADRCERLLSYPPSALQASKRALLQAYSTSPSP